MSQYVLKCVDLSLSHIEFPLKRVFAMAEHNSGNSEVDLNFCSSDKDELYERSIVII